MPMPAPYAQSPAPVYSSAPTETVEIIEPPAQSQPRVLSQTPTVVQAPAIVQPPVTAKPLPDSTSVRTTSGSPPRIEPVPAKFSTGEPAVGLAETRKLEASKTTESSKELPAVPQLPDFPPPPLPADSTATTKDGTEVLRHAPRPIENSCPGGDCKADCNKCCKPLKFLIFGEYLYWSVHNADVPFAQAFDGTDPFNSVPRGPVGVVSPHFQNGFRAGAGVAIGETGWLVGTFTYFHETASGSVAAPDTFVLHNFLVFPNTVNSSGDSLTASATTSVDLQTGDIDYKCAFVCTDHLSVLWVAGGRYARLGQKLEANYNLTGTTTVESSINFNGGGPRVGLEGEYKILRGFYGYGKGMLDLLVGRFQGSYQESNVFTGLIGSTAIGENRIVPVLELEIGAGWQSRNGRIRVSGGYYVGNWFNVMTIPTLATGIQRNDFTTNGNNLRDSLIFDGFVGHVEFRF